MLLTAEEKLRALNALSLVALHQRDDGTWWIDHRRVEIKNGKILSCPSGNGRTPEEAILDHWRQLVDEVNDRYIVVNADRKSRLAVRWNGFMWRHVDEV